MTFHVKPTVPAITVDWLLARCVEDGDCLVWKGRCDNGADPRASMDRRKFYVRRAVWVAMHGRDCGGDYFIGTSCGNPRCCHPAHVVRRSRSQALRGVPKSFATRVKIAEAKRRQSELPQAVIAEILASPLKGEEEAKRRGMCKSSINKIRAGTMRREYTGPFAALLGVAGG